MKWSTQDPTGVKMVYLVTTFRILMLYKNLNLVSAMDRIRLSEIKEED